MVMLTLLNTQWMDVVVSFLAIINKGSQYQVLSYIHIKSLFSISSIYTFPKNLCTITLAEHSSRSGSVEALLLVLLLKRLHGEGSAIAVAAGVLVAGKPYTEATARSVRAGLEADIASQTGSSEDQVTVVVDLEGATLLVLADGLHSGGVPENTLAHAAAVDVHAERWEVAVQVEAAVFLVEGEGCVVDTTDNVVTVAIDAAGLVVLGRSVDDETAVLGLDVTVLDCGAAAERHQTEDIAGSGAGEGLGLRKGGRESGHGGSGGSGGELHDDGWWWWY
jgi:hypothetical protein